MAQSRSSKNSSKRKSSSGRSSSSRSRSTGTRSSSSRGKRLPPGAPSAGRKSNLVRSVLLAGLGILCVAMVLVPGQNIWKVMRGGLFGIFGIMTYLVGPFLLYLAYLLASGYRVALFAGKVTLMGILWRQCPGGILQGFSQRGQRLGNHQDAFHARSDRLLGRRRAGAPIGATLLALFGRPASNFVMLLVFALGLMVFFAITPVDGGGVPQRPVPQSAGGPCRA